MRGDELLAREGIREIDFLKIDVEGAEHLVLRGLEGLLRERRVRFVQFEYGKIYPDHVEIRDYELGDEDFMGRTTSRVEPRSRY